MFTFRLLPRQSPKIQVECVGDYHKNQAFSTIILARRYLPSRLPLTQLSLVRIPDLFIQSPLWILIRLMMYFLETGEFEGRPGWRQCPANDKLKYANEELSDVWMEFVMIRTAIVSLSGTTLRSRARRITWLCSFSGDLGNEILSGSSSRGRMKRFCSFGVL